MAEKYKPIKVKFARTFKLKDGIFLLAKFPHNLPHRKTFKDVLRILRRVQKQVIYLENHTKEPTRFGDTRHKNYSTKAR